MDSNNENDFTLLYCEAGVFCMFKKGEENPNLLVSFDGLHFEKIDAPGVREKIEENKNKFNEFERIREENESKATYILKVLWNKGILWIANSLMLSLRKR